MKKKLAIASLLLGSSLFASSEGLSLKIGAGNVKVGSLSDSATKIGAEFSFITNIPQSKLRPTP